MQIFADEIKVLINGDKERVNRFYNLVYMSKEYEVEVIVKEKQRNAV